MRAIDGAFGTGDRSARREGPPRLDPTLQVNARPSVVVEGSNPLDGRLTNAGGPACGRYMAPERIRICSATRGAAPDADVVAETFLT